MFSQQVSKELIYWQEKRLQSPHSYNAHDPVILVDLVEIEEQFIANQHAFQLQMNIYQQQRPEKHENLLMSLSDALLQALQQWMTNRQVPLTSTCSMALQAVEPLPLPLRKWLAVFLNIPVFAFYPRSIQVTRKLQAMMDAMSFYLLLARFQNPKMDLKLVIVMY